MEFVGSVSILHKSATILNLTCFGKELFILMLLWLDITYLSLRTCVLHIIQCMYDGWFVPLWCHRLQICSNGGTTTK